MELFEQRLADAEEAVYGQRRRKEGAEWTARRSENESRDRWRRQVVDKTGTKHRRGNERDSSPVHEERYHDRGRKEGREHGKEDRFRDKDGEREDIERSRKRERSADKGKEKEKWGASSAFRSYQSSSFGSHKSQFLKPSEDGDRGEAI